MTKRKSTLKNIDSGCAVRSEHRIDILNIKSVGKEHLNVFITEPLIEKMVSFWDSVKKFVLKNLAIFTGKQLCWSLF